MSNKTKIVVLHLKEIIYTGIFALLGILFIVLLIIMFLPDKADKEPDVQAPTESELPMSTYVPGIYTTCVSLGEQRLDIEVIVDENHINSVEIVNLTDEVSTMYPLIAPAFQEIQEQILSLQTLEGITYADESKYTSLVLLDAIRNSLNKALPEAPIASEEVY